MIAVDSNILVYAHKKDAPFHTEAKAALSELVRSADTWAIPWPCVHEFFAVVTNPRVFIPASTPAEAIAQLEAWASVPNVRLLSESHSHLARLTSLVLPRLAGPAVHDAKIAAICLDHGVRALLTTDRDFSRFPALKTRSLLA
ncbi:MAG: TA system VapC family ribonuclease toxin [Jatrophihabitantaceae bacterium]